MNNTVSLIDYGVGNLWSVIRALQKIDVQINVIQHPHDIKNANWIILPGVGAFNQGMQALNKLGFKEALLEHHVKQRPILGICLGMQMLFDSSEENGLTQGLSLIPGKVIKIHSTSSSLKIPHIGWSALQTHSADVQFAQNQWFYFVHSYHAVTSQDYVMANTLYHNESITAIVKKDNIYGCQFHPEKSGNNGLHLLNTILKMS